MVWPTACGVRAVETTPKRRTDRRINHLQCHRIIADARDFDERQKTYLFPGSLWRGPLSGWWTMLFTSGEVGAGVPRPHRRMSRRSTSLTGRMLPDGADPRVRSPQNRPNPAASGWPSRQWKSESRQYVIAP